MQGALVTLCHSAVKGRSLIQLEAEIEMCSGQVVMQSALLKH